MNKNLVRKQQVTEKIGKQMELARPDDKSCVTTQTEQQLLVSPGDRRH